MKEAWSGQDQTSHLCWHYLSFRAVTSQVFSARVSLTAVFGMGTGGPSPQSAPTSSLWTSHPSLRHSFYILTDRSAKINYILFFSPWSVPHSRESGTPSGTRTLDTLIKSQVLYQLS